MSTTTIEAQLADARLRIVRLQAAAGASPRLRRHLDALGQEEASVRAAADLAPDEVEARLGQLTSRIDVAEHSVAADATDDWTTFATAVEAELASWDTYLERLQTNVATKTWKARARAEEAIGDVRAHRIAVAEQLAQARDGTGHASQEQRDRVVAARDALEENADDLSATFK